VEGVKRALDESLSLKKGSSGVIQRHQFFFLLNFDAGSDGNQRVKAPRRRGKSAMDKKGNWYQPKSKAPAANCP